MINLAGLQEWAGLAGATLDEAAVAVAGIPYDGSAVYRRGAGLAPARIRELSAVMPPVTEAGRHLLGMAVHDLGDLDPGPSIAGGWGLVADQLAAVPAGKLLTVLGGDHCSVIPVLAAQTRRHPDLALVWVDAHPDLCDFSRGSAWSCGCALRRALEMAGLPDDRVTFVGSRDYDIEEIDWIVSRGRPDHRVAEVAADPAGVGVRVGRRLRGRPVHVSLDIDVLDPAAAPGTEIPSAGGLTTRQLLEFLAALVAEADLVGFDVMEVAPPLDHNDITAFAALKLIFETWGMAWKQPTS